MEKITAKTAKRGEYHHAVLLVNETGKKYVSKDMFVTKKTALKQAEWWKYETLQIGQVIDY